MVFLYLVAAIAALTTLSFQILPDSSFLAPPDAVWAALSTVTGWLSWAVGLGGSEVRTAVLAAAAFLISFKLAVFLIEILRRFSFPIINKYLR